MDVLETDCQTNTQNDTPSVPSANYHTHVRGLQMREQVGA